MLGLFVSRWSLGRAVDLHEYKPGRVVLVLNDIKAGDSRFLNAFSSVGERRGFKSLDEFGFYLDMHMYNKHRFPFLRWPRQQGERY